MKARIVIIAIVAIALSLVFVKAQARLPKKTPPSPTGGFRKNNFTGVLRMMLDKNGLIAPCRHNETATTLSDLEQGSVCISKITGAIRELPTGKSCHPSEEETTLDQIAQLPAPPTVTATETATATATVTATPRMTAPTITPTPSPTVVPSAATDANGKVIGYLLDDDSGFTQSTTALVMDINNQFFAVEAVSGGFLDSQANSIQDGINNETIFYSGTNCTGTVYIESQPIGADVLPFPAVPIIFSAVADNARIGAPGGLTLQNAWVDNGYLFYPALPYSNETAESEILDPTFNADGTVGGDCANSTQTIFGGTLGLVNLNTLGFATPFNGVPTGETPTPSPTSDVPISTPTP